MRSHVNVFQPSANTARASKSTSLKQRDYSRRSHTQGRTDTIRLHILRSVVRVAREGNERCCG